MGAGKYLAISAVQFKPADEGEQFMVSLANNQLQSVRGAHALDVNISSREVELVPRPHAPQHNPLSPPPTIADSILEKLYRDKSHADVTFTFNRSKNQLLAQGLSDSSSELDTDHDKGHVSIMDVDQRELVMVEHLGKDLDKNEDIQAHKLVLCQWPYFKAMFEDGFAESSPGAKQIHINDCKAQAFQLLIHFMYMGKLPKDTDLEVCADMLVDQEDASWEDLCIVAHMYDVQELHEQAADMILQE
ncbi:hypothetical protein BGZ93_010113 [Podila epicladia]|nr:hypothetical protein BGZ92_009509 [Podila epicladia]KAG0098858.1 hypothetical protein BGZ93_010113 [Podila epicladia]